MKSPVALLDSLLTQDFSRLNPGVKGLRRDLVTAQRRIKHEGTGFLSQALPALDDALVQGLSSGKFTCPVGFKKIRGGTIPVFLQGMFGEIFDPITGHLKEPIEYGVLRDVHTFLRLFKKTQLCTDDEELLHQKAVAEFYQCDETAKSVTISDRQDHLIGHVGRLILLTLFNKDYENEKIYRHGPGAVQESYKGNQKWSALYGELGSANSLPEWFGWTNDRLSHSDSSLTVRVICRHVLPVSHGPTRVHDLSRGACDHWRNTQFSSDNPVLSAESARNSEACHCSEERAAALVAGDSRPQSKNAAAPSRHRGASAKLISVLKNSSSRRTITIEPLLRQYLQQGLNTVLRESITECQILSNCLALTDQSKNQKTCSGRLPKP